MLLKNQLKKFPKRALPYKNEGWFQISYPFYSRWPSIFREGFNRSDSYFQRFRSRLELFDAWIGGWQQDTAQARERA